MRSSTVHVDAARNVPASEAATSRKIRESVAIHAALGPIAIEMRLQELNRDITAHNGGCEPNVALLLVACGHDGAAPRRRFLFRMAGAGILAWLAVARWPDSGRPSPLREVQRAQEIQQEREALLELKRESS